MNEKYLIWSLFRFIILNYLKILLLKCLLNFLEIWFNFIVKIDFSYLFVQGNDFIEVKSEKILGFILFSVK